MHTDILNEIEEWCRKYTKRNYPRQVIVHFFDCILTLAAIRLIIFFIDLTFNTVTLGVHYLELISQAGIIILFIIEMIYDIRKLNYLSSKEAGS